MANERVTEMAVKALTPDELKCRRVATFNPRVIEAVNELMVRHSRGANSFKLQQSEVIASLVVKGFTKEEIFNEGFLDFEEVYEAAGWRVVYDKPGYNEDYDAFWKFSPR